MLPFVSDKFWRVSWGSASIPWSRQDSDVAAAPTETLQPVVQFDVLLVRDHDEERGRPPGARHQGPDYVKKGLGDSLVASNKPGDKTEAAGS